MLMGGTGEPQAREEAGGLLPRGEQLRGLIKSFPSLLRLNYPSPASPPAPREELQGSFLAGCK